VRYTGGPGGFYGDASRGGAYQPINYIINQVAASDGTATFLFDAVALSNTWTLTINCAGAPDTAIWVAQSGGTSFGQFKGSNSWGPLQLQGGDRLQVNGSGLIPGTNYQVAGYGYANIVNEPEIVYPTAYADSVTTSTQQIYLGSSFIASIGSTTQVTIATVPVSSTYRSIYLLGTANGPNVLSYCTYFAIGNVTGFGYDGIVIPYASNPSQVAVRIPFISSSDTMLTIKVIAPSGSQVVNATFYYGGDLANVDTAVYPGGTFDVTVANPTTDPVNVNIVSGGGSGGGNVTVVNTTSQPVPIKGVQGSGGTAVSITPGDTSVTPLYVQVVGGTLTSVTMGGDVTGQSNSATVVGLEGKLINGAATTAGQVLVYTGSLWTNTTSTGYVASTGKIVMDQSPTITTPTLSGNTTAGTINSTTIPASSTLVTTSTIASNAVTTFNAGTTGLTPATATRGAVTLSGTLAIANGGTGNATAPTIGSVVYGATITNYDYLAGNTTTTPSFVTSTGDGTNPLAPTLTSSTGSGTVVLSTSPTLSGNTTAGTINNTTIPASSTLITTGNIASSAVSSINGGTTGLTPSTATKGAVTLGGTLASANGGTGISTVTLGSLLVGNTGNAWSGLTIGSAGQVLTVNSVSNFPVWQTPTPTLSYVQASLSSNVAVTTTLAATGLSISLTAGTWLITLNVSIQNTASGSCFIAIGPTSASFTGAYVGFFPSVSSANSPLILSTNRVIVLASTTTVYLNAGYYVSGSGTLLATSAISGIPNATEIVAVRIA
jgi:hypothetical protein